MHINQRAFAASFIGCMVTICSEIVVIVIESGSNGMVLHAGKEKQCETFFRMFL